ncbi:hypothetical protein KW787_01870 [Candidatus Pacearchaeota archaeon]|nr:hypothetical protein [Candidatus Pacearchaeota archaeon]
METIAAIRRKQKTNSPYIPFANSLIDLYNHMDLELDKSSWRWSTVLDDPQESGDNPVVLTEPTSDTLNPSLSIVLKPQLTKYKAEPEKFYAPMLVKRGPWDIISKTLENYLINKSGNQEFPSNGRQRSLLELVHDLGMDEVINKKMWITEAVAFFPVDLSSDPEFKLEFYPQMGFGSYSANYAAHTVVESRLSEGFILTSENRRNPILEQHDGNMYQFSVDTTTHYDIDLNSKKTSQGHMIILAAPIRPTGEGILGRVGIPLASAYPLEPYIPYTGSNGNNHSNGKSLTDLSIIRGSGVGRYNKHFGEVIYTTPGSRRGGMQAKFNTDLAPALFHIRLEAVPIERTKTLGITGLTRFAEDLGMYITKK